MTRPVAAASRRAPAGAGGFALLYVGPFLVYADRFTIPPMLFAISADLREPLGAVTTVATLYFLLYGLLQLPYGLASDRLGRVLVLRVALVGLGVANLAAALAPSLPVLAAAKAPAAGAAAAVLPTSLVYIGDRLPFDRRQPMIANVLAAGAVGTVLGTIGAGLVAQAGLWRAAFAVPAVLALLTAAALGRLPESLSGVPGGGVVAALRKVLARRWAMFVIVLAVGEGAVMVGFLVYLAPALEAYGQPAAVAGLVVAGYGLAVFAGTQALKPLLRQTSVGAAALIGFGGALLAAAWALAATHQGPAAIGAASGMAGLGFALAHSTLQTWATEVVPEVRGTATSLFVTAVFTGAAAATAAVSGLADAGRFGLIFGLAAAVTVPVLGVAALGRARYGRT